MGTRVKLHPGKPTAQSKKKYEVQKKMTNGENVLLGLSNIPTK